MSRICLVTPSHPSSNPRLVKEADTLHAAGYQVHVVAGRYFPPLDAFDAELYARVSWQRTVVDYTGGPRALTGKLVRRLARLRLASGQLPSLRLATAAHHAAITALARAAVRTQADLYIGHCLAGLAAAGLAATRTGGRLGFDAEDFHPAETDAAETDPVEINSIRRIEAEFLPRCRHFTAASPLIGQVYAKRYDLPLPLTVLNTFSLAEAPPHPVTPERPGGLPLLYWFSQTIGPNRGLEPLITALAQMVTPCALRLRGLPANGFPDHLRRLARNAGFAGPIEFVELAAPDQMMALAAGADLGLSLEQGTPRNRDYCLTNKIFTYLAAGIPVALTPTSAQLALGQELGAAALTLDLVRPAEAAARLDHLLANPAELALARKAAWHAGRTRFHWDYACTPLLASVATAITA